MNDVTITLTPKYLLNMLQEAYEEGYDTMLPNQVMDTSDKLSMTRYLSNVMGFVMYGDDWLDINQFSKVIVVGES